MVSKPYIDIYFFVHSICVFDSQFFWQVLDELYKWMRFISILSAISLTEGSDERQGKQGCQWSKI
jgi:hypothetical protein